MLVKRNQGFTKIALHFVVIRITSFFTIQILELNSMISFKNKIALHFAVIGVTSFFTLTNIRTHQSDTIEEQNRNT